MEGVLTAPEPTFTPIREQGWLLVQVPTDFRVDPSTWQPITATASIPAGPLTQWVTAVATPERLVFRHGDTRDNRPDVWCNGDDPIAPYVTEEPGACSYTYRNSSATAPYGDEFDAQFRTRWSITYTTSDGDAGTLDMPPTVTDLRVAVAERKAFIECVGDTC